MTNRAEFERLLDVYGFRCERFGQDLSTHARAQVVSAFAALASAPADERAALHHVANEWADMATCAIQWIRNIKNGVSTPEAALENLMSNLTHCQEVQSCAGVRPSRENAPVAGEAQPVCWIEKDVLESVRDEGSDAWVYWRPAGHVAEHDEMPLFAAPQASASDFAKLQSAYVAACDRIGELLAAKQTSAENAPVAGEAQPVGEVFRHGEGRDENGPRVGIRMLPAAADLPHGTQVYAAPQASERQTTAARDVLAERQRQISVEGWSAHHDDAYTDAQLALAASCYALPPGEFEIPGPPQQWPWPSAWWKPGDRRRELVKAGALILAEIERLDRAALPGAATEDAKP